MFSLRPLERGLLPKQVLDVQLTTVNGGSTIFFQLNLGLLYHYPGGCELL